MTKDELRQILQKASSLFYLATNFPYNTDPKLDLQKCADIQRQNEVDATLHDFDFYRA